MDLKVENLSDITKREDSYGGKVTPLQDDNSSEATAREQIGEDSHQLLEQTRPHENEQSTMGAIHLQEIHKEDELN